MKIDYIIYNRSNGHDCYFDFERTFDNNGCCKSSWTKVKAYISIILKAKSFLFLLFKSSYLLLGKTFSDTQKKRHEYTFFEGDFEYSPLYVVKQLYQLLLVFVLFDVQVVSPFRFPIFLVY